MNGLESLLNPDEHMTDDDRGLHAEQFNADLALLQHRQAHAVDANAVSADWCDACGAEIPEGRRAALPGVRVCVDCARESEKMERLQR